MRVSCRKTDLGYVNFRGYGTHLVFLNGIEQSEVLTADEERGEIICHARDEHGQLIVDHGERVIVDQLVRGKVEVITVARHDVAKVRRLLRDGAEVALNESRK